MAHPLLPPLPLPLLHHLVLVLIVHIREMHDCLEEWREVVVEGVVVLVEVPVLHGHLMTGMYKTRHPLNALSLVYLTSNSSSHSLAHSCILVSIPFSPNTLLFIPPLTSSYSSHP